MHDGRAIANEILDVAARLDRNVSNLALQKILFFSHGWALAVHGTPLIRQNFEAWQFGPVLAHVYREFKEFDREAITRRARKLDAASGEFVEARVTLPEPAIDLLEKVVGFYSKLRPGTLVELSHAEDGPWAEVWNHKSPLVPGMRLIDSRIEQYFKSLAVPF